MQELSQAGYKCEIANSGLLGVERIMLNPPDLAVINLNLTDIPGDLAILRLQAMQKTKHIKYLLYLQKNNMLDKAVIDNLSHKSGVKVLCAYVDPAEIAQAAENIFQESEQEV